MICKKCGADMGDALRCVRCGAVYAAPKDEKAKEEKSGSAKKIVEDITERVKDTFEDITGGSKEAEFKLSDLWANVFKKHTDEESEDLLISGTKRHTPRPEDIGKGWHRPWLYSRIFLVLAITFAFLFVCFQLFGNDLAIVGLAFIGSMVMPFSLLVLFWETNIPRNISIFELVKMFFVGGVASLAMALLLFELIPVQELNVVGAILVGIIEEVGKLLPVAYFIYKSKSKYILNGILIGAAIGAGFAVFESAGYALFRTESVNDIVNNILLRGILAAGGHIVWAAMSGAAIMLAKGDGEFGMRIFKSGKFWKLFPVPIVLHALWDMPFSTILMYVLLVVIAWVFILALIRAGMTEVNRLTKKGGK